jgi:hypothetical protein
VPPSLASPEDLATFMRRDVDTANAEVLLAAASALVRTYCGWVIAPAETGVVFTVDGSGARVQPLPTRHLTAVTAVTEDGEDAPLKAIEWSEAGYLYRAQKFTRKLRGLAATVDHGYTDVPAEIEMVALTVAARGVGNPQGLRSYTTGNISATYAGEGAGTGPLLNPLEMAVLSRYRLPERP